MIAFILLLAPAAQAGEWRATLNRSGFFGALSVGAIYTWQERHSVELSLGGYSNDGQRDYQSNIAYRYSRWNIPFENRNWRPLSFGLFAVRSWDTHHYFLTTPEHYPYDGYYESTRIRAGVEVGSVLQFERWELAYFLRLLDIGLIAVYNNADKELQYYSSSGLSIRYRF